MSIITNHTTIPNNIISIYELFKINDVLLCILDFLTFKDLYILLIKSISHEMTKSLLKLSKKNVLILCLFKHYSLFGKKFGINSTTLMSCLRRVHGVTAGGFALALFTGELYKESDIDIYIPAKTEIQFQNKINKSGLKSILINNGYVEYSFTTSSPPYLYNYYEYINENLNRKIQILNHHTNKKYNYHTSEGKSIIKNYDFSTVMCFIEPCKITKFRFHCEHLYDVINKTIKLNTNCNRLKNKTLFMSTLLPRILKYKKRGYKICDSINESIPDITNQLIKYEIENNNY